MLRAVLLLLAFSAFGARQIRAAPPSISFPQSSRAAPLASLRVDGETRVMGGRQEFDEVVISGGGAISVTRFAGGFGEGALELVARRIQVDAGSAINADGAGFRGITEGKGEGPGGGEGGETSLAAWAALRPDPARLALLSPSPRRRPSSAWTAPAATGGGRGSPTAGLARPLHATGSGAGGGYGGKGGDGIFMVNRGEWKGGSPYGAPDGEDVQLGSAGGAAPRSHHEVEYIKGGNGGGIVILRAQEVVINGTVSASGGAGEQGEFDATGGGAGGTVLIHAPVLRVAGKVEARGGRGGQAVDVGGSGAGGRVKLFTRDSSRPDLARVDVSPGSGPCPGEIASPRGCPGTVYVGRLPEAPLYLPYAGRGTCLIPPALALALVVDTSDSMAKPAREGVAGSRLAAAQAAASTLAGWLGPRDRAGLVLFDVAADLAAPLGLDRGLLRAALRAAATHSGSRLDRGLAAGSALLAGAAPGEQRLLVLLTDGLPDGVTDAEVVAEAAAVRASGVKLVVLGYASGGEEAASKALLGRLASGPDDLLQSPSADALAAWWQADAVARCPR